MIEIFSPAKINLTLDVFAKKPDAGFHEIETIYHKLDWGDTITVEKNDRFELIGDFECVTEQNLIYQAWKLIQNLDLRDRSRLTNQAFETGLGKLPPVKVTVDKQIPSQAGLGGGSSNAAHFILAYFELFSLGSIPKDLALKLENLGKDIPFFLQPAVCALGTGYGEIIKPLDFNFSGTPVFIYQPEFTQSTATAYSQLQNFDTDYTGPLLKNKNLTNSGNSFNQLFEQNNYSKIIPPSQIKNVQLCGSGSCFYSFKNLEITGTHKKITTLL